MFEKFVETINSTGKAVGEKTKQGSEIARANIKITAEKRALDDIYAEIGKHYCKQHNQTHCCEEMKELCDKAEEKVYCIEQLKNQIRVLKGVNICPNCGAEIPFENDFCGKCGAKIEHPVQSEQPAEPEAESENSGDDKPDIDIKVVPDGSGE